ncbi:MAG: SURF1 family protein [Dehalococcoidia bacterium]|jgi:surfeit locus 1 family protein|nr:SURF1 family protein [Dehalococcoidia bacterium]
MTFRVPTPILLGAILGVVAILVALGIWQLQRNDWKNHLVAERNARATEAPLTSEDALSTDPANLDYRRLIASGTWDYEHSFILGNRARLQTRGEQLVTPFLLTPDGPAVLVNRGWYPLAERDAVLADLSSQLDQSLAGLIRTGAGRGQQTDSGLWTALDPVAMGETLPYPVVDWLVIEGAQRQPGEPSSDGTLPVQGYLPYASNTPHLEYAATWLGLAIVLVVVAAVRFVIEPRRARRREVESATNR